MGHPRSRNLPVLVAIEVKRDLCAPLLLRGPCGVLVAGDVEQIAAPRASSRQALPRLGLEDMGGGGAEIGEALVHELHAVALVIFVLQ